MSFVRLWKALHRTSWTPCPWQLSRVRRRWKLPLLFLPLGLHHPLSWLPMSAVRTIKTRCYLPAPLQPVLLLSWMLLKQKILEWLRWLGWLPKTCVYVYIDQPHVMHIISFLCCFLSVCDLSMIIGFTVSSGAWSWSIWRTQVCFCIYRMQKLTKYHIFYHLIPWSGWCRQSWGAWWLCIPWWPAEIQERQEGCKR